MRKSTWLARGNTFQNESGPKGKQLCDVQKHTRTLHLSNNSDISACVSSALENTDTPFRVSLQNATLPPHGQLELQARVRPHVLVNVSITILLNAASFWVILMFVHAAPKWARAGA